MRRLALVGLIALVGCGGSKPAAAPTKDATSRKHVKRNPQVEKAIKNLDKTDLPDDMKRELRDAKKLLDESK